MNYYTGYELLWLFFIYSFGGWVLETISATLKQRKFANRGLVNGPFCVLYGLTAIAMTVGLQELRGIWLFIFATVYATVAEWVSGHLIEKVHLDRTAAYHQRRRKPRYQMEPGWIYLSSGFTILGCARLSGSEMVQWGHVDFITYSAEASDAYCAADTDRCTFCGYLWFLYASYRKE
jgi:hypothetical protein